MARKLRVGVTKTVFPRPEFEKIIRKYLSMKDADLVMLAYRLAKYGHKGQTRDDLSRYFDHVKGAALIFMLELGIFCPFLLISELLHDIKERSFILKYRDIERIFGEKVMIAVKILTKKRGDYLGSLKDAHWSVQLAKLPDVLHNLRTLRNCKKEKIIRKLEEAGEFYVPFTRSLKKQVPRELKNSVDYLLREIKLSIFEGKKLLK